MPQPNTDLCLACLRPTGRDDPPRGHHVCGRVHAPAVEIRVHNSCHLIFNEAQRAAGVQLGDHAAGDPVQVVWASACGFAAWINLSTGLTAEPDRRLHLFGQLLAALGERRLGPNSIANDVRRSKDRGRRVQADFSRVEHAELWLRSLAGALDATLRDAGETGGPVRALLQDVRERPGGWLAALDRLDLDRAQGLVDHALATLLPVVRGETSDEEARIALRPLAVLLQERKLP